MATIPAEPVIRALSNIGDSIATVLADGELDDGSRATLERLCRGCNTAAAGFDDLAARLEAVS